MTYNVEKFDKGGDIPSGTYAAIANTVKMALTRISGHRRMLQIP